MVSSFCSLYLYSSPFGVRNSRVCVYVCMRGVYIGLAFTHPSLNPSIVADLMKQDTWENDNVLIQELRPQSALSAWINDACTAADHKQMEYLSSHMLGKSQHTIEPAGSFDVFLGVGTRC